MMEGSDDTSVASNSNNNGIGYSQHHQQQQQAAVASAATYNNTTTAVPSPYMVSNSNSGSGIPTNRNLRPVVVPTMMTSSSTSSSNSGYPIQQQQQSQHSSVNHHTTAAVAPQPTPEQRAADINRAIQYWLDKSTIHIVPRWITFFILLVIFFLRVYLVQGYFIVAYGLGIFLLNNFIAFLSPLDDPSMNNNYSVSSNNNNDDGLSLPTSAKDGKEFRPFTRRLPEFKFWYSSIRGVVTSIGMTFFTMFDIPVFWPILLIYFFILFTMTMKRQIMHMIQHKYIPISYGKVKSKNAGIERGMFGGGKLRR